MHGEWAVGGQLRVLRVTSCIAPLSTCKWQHSELWCAYLHWHACLQVLGPHVRLSTVTWLNGLTIFPLSPLFNLLPVHPDTDRFVMPVRMCGLGC